MAVVDGPSTRPASESPSSSKCIALRCMSWLETWENTIARMDNRAIPEVVRTSRNPIRDARPQPRSPVDTSAMSNQAIRFAVRIHRVRSQVFGNHVGPGGRYSPSAARSFLVAVWSAFASLRLRYCPKCFWMLFT